MSQFIFSARPAVFLVLTCCLAWSTAFAEPPAVYLAEGFPIVPPDTTTTTTTTTTTVSTFIPPPPPPPPACVHVDGQPPYGRLDFLFGDGRGGWADLNGYFSPVCSNGALVGLQTVTAGSGRAGNLAHPFYLLSAALSSPPPSLSLSLSPPPPGGETTIAIHNLNMSQSITALPTPGFYHVVLAGSFTSCHPNHGCGDGSFSVQGDISCC